MTVGARGRGGVGSARASRVSRSSSSGLGPLLLFALGLLSAVAPFSVDLYLPAFPTIADDLETSPASVQLSLTAFLVGAGTGQLFFGPLSDRFGRRVPLVVGMGTYVVASAAAALAPSLVLLVAARLVQGLSGAAGMVISRAVVSDRAHGRTAARAFSIMMLVGGVAPVIAPFIGSLLLEPLGWRGLLGVVTGIGVLSALAAVLLVRESNPPSNRDARAGGASSSHRALLSPIYLGYALAYSAGFAALMAYISASPFLYQTMMGFNAVAYGTVFAINALGLGAASYLAARLTQRFQVRGVARVGLTLNVTAIVVMAGLVVGGAPLSWIVFPMFLAVASLGLVFGTTTALALDAAPGVAGAASAVLGFLQFALGGLVSPLAGVAGETSPLPILVTMLCASVVAICGLSIANAYSRRRRADGGVSQADRFSRDTE